jgi:hypothetical protein
VSFGDFSADGAQVADASAALIFLVRFFIKEKMNTTGKRELDLSCQDDLRPKGRSVHDFREMV